MTLRELLEKGFIDIEDNVDFRTHSDVMRLFGNNRINTQISFYKHPVEPGVHIWFPVFYQDASNDWENTWSQNQETAFERRKIENAAYLKEMSESADRHTRILFAKLAPSGKASYKFKGVYKFDPELSE